MQLQVTSQEHPSPSIATPAYTSSADTIQLIFDDFAMLLDQLVGTVAMSPFLQAE